MQCSPAVRSRGLQVRAAAELWAAVASLLVPEQVCHPHHSPSCRTTCATQPKKLYASLQLYVSVVPTNKTSDPRIQAYHARFLGALNPRDHRTVHRLSSTFSHVADLPKASTKPCSVHSGRPKCVVDRRAEQTILLAKVTCPNTGRCPLRGPASRSGPPLEKQSWSKIFDDRAGAFCFAARLATTPRFVDRF